MKDTIVLMKFGSHLYGTDTPASDLDFKGIYVPSARDIVLQRVKNNTADKRDKKDGEKNLAGEIDEDYYSIQYYLELLSQGQTVAIDMLFAPDSAIIRKDPVWDWIVANKRPLLSKKSAAFVGYCRQQANKYGIKGSRVSAAKAAMEMFARAVEAFGSTAKVKEAASLVGFEYDMSLHKDHMSIVQQQVNKAGDVGTFFECCNRKVGYENTVKEAYQIFSRIYENYGARAKLAQSNEGIDWKALSHAVRVGNEAVELLSTENVTFPLPNAAHILDIKQGKIEYNEVAEEIEQLLIDVEEASARSSLPETADQTFIDNIVHGLYSSQVILANLNG